MKSRHAFDSALLGGVLCGFLIGLPQLGWGQSFAGSIEPTGIAGVPAALSAADSSLYADGTRAINEGRWANAETILAQVASQHGDHSDGALYWKAYAENKQGNPKSALATCTELSHAFPTSSWIHDCGALEIEIQAQSGKPIDPKTTQDDELKLLALNSLMQKDPPRALAQIQEILNGDSSAKLKEEAAFILAQHDSDATHAQIAPRAMRTSRSIRLDVVVTAKSGSPVASLEQKDFTLLDNNSPQAITSFKVVSMGQEPVEVILLLDAVNTEFDTVAYERGKVQNFLQANGGRLAYSTAIAVLTDKGLEIQQGFSTNGNTLNDVLGHYTIGLREISRGTLYGVWDRWKISLTAVHQLAGYAATLPGRKIVLWISPGWPLLSGAGDYLYTREHQQIFSNIVSLSTELRQAGVTLYNINPRDATYYYETLLKGISKPSQTEYGDLSLQVLAIQSGGLALQSDSDVQGMIKRCFADIASWYEITFDAPAAEQPNEYHHVQVKLDKPGLKARMRDGYYAQP